MSSSPSTYTINTNLNDEHEDLTNMLYGMDNNSNDDLDLEIIDIAYTTDQDPNPNPSKTTPTKQKLNLKEGVHGPLGETSLLTDWEDYKWLEPDIKLAQEKGRLAVFGGTDLSLFTSVDKLNALGIGIQLYFKLLQHLAITMFLLTLCSAPITATFVYGNRFSLRPYFIDPLYFVYTTVANIGDQKSTAKSCVADKVTGLCEQSLKQDTVTLGGYVPNFALERFSVWAAVCDASYIVIYVLSVLYFRRSIRIMEVKEDKNRTTITDYTIVVKGFPRKATKRDIVQFFSDRFNPNDDLGRVYDNPEQRVIDNELHGITEEKDKEDIDEEEKKRRLKRQKEITRNQAIAEGLYVHDVEEEKRIKQEKTPEFFKKWKAQDEDHRKKVISQTRMKKMEKTMLKRDFYPVVNSANTGENDLYQGTWVAEVTMAYEDGTAIRRYMTKQKIVRAIQRNKALVQMYSSGSQYEDLDPDNVFKEECKKIVKELEEKLGKLGDTHASSGGYEASIGESTFGQGFIKKATDGEERRAVMAFVVFNHETSFLRAVEAYGTSWSSILNRCQPRRLRWQDGTSLHVTRAPDPSDLYWENLDTTNCNRRVRVFITSLITLSVLAVSFGVSLIVYGSIGEISNLLGNTGNSCDSIKADIVRHAQRYDIANKTATNTFFNSNATLFPLTYLQLNTNIKPVRMSNNECPENWMSIQYVDSDTNLPVLNDWSDTVLNSPSCIASMCPIDIGSTSLFETQEPLSFNNCKCIPNEAALLDLDTSHICTPMACTSGGSSIVLTDGIIQNNGTLQNQGSEITTEGEILSAADPTCKTYGPAEIRTCYCVETMNSIFEQLGTSLGMAKFLAQDGDICSSIAIVHYGARQLSFAAVFLVVGLNVVLQKLVAFLAHWERHPTKTAYLSAQMMKTFVVLFINTGFVVLIVNSTFGKVRFSEQNGTEKDGDGGFSSFSTLWYSQVGVSITLTMCLDMFTPHLPKLFQAFVRQPIKQRCLKNRRKCKGMRKKSAMQEDVNEIFDGITFVLPVRLATVLNTLAMTISYSGGLPALIPLACISFTLSFNIDRMMLLRFYKRPPEYTTTLVLNYFSVVPIVVLIHLGFSAWMFSDPTVMWSEKLNLSRFKDYGAIYTDSVNYLEQNLKYWGNQLLNNNFASQFIETMADRILRLSAVPQILAFVTIICLYFLNFIFETFANVSINVRVCFGQLDWCNCLCKNRGCRLCCENGDVGFEENPPFTEHYIKPCRDNTGRLIRSKELADKSYITTEERTKGFNIEFDDLRKISYRSKVWGTGGEAFGTRHEGRTQQFTYEMLLYFQGSAFSYSIHQVQEYKAIIEAQNVSKKQNQIYERRQTILLDKKNLEKEIKKLAKVERRNSLRELKKLKKQNSSRRGWSFGGSSRKLLTKTIDLTSPKDKEIHAVEKEIEEARKTANAADESGDEEGENQARVNIKNLKLKLKTLNEEKEEITKLENEIQSIQKQIDTARKTANTADETGDQDTEDEARALIKTLKIELQKLTNEKDQKEKGGPIELSRNNILTWSAGSKSDYARRTWKLRNKVKIMNGGMQSAVKLAAVQESKLHNIDNVEMGNVEMDSIDMNENETKKTKEEMEEEAMFLDDFELVEEKKEKKGKKEKKEEKDQIKESKKKEVKKKDTASKSESESDSDSDDILDIASSDDEIEIPTWVKLFDSTHTTFYYLNNISHESVWEQPMDYISPRRDASYSIMRILNPEVQAALMLQKAYRCKQSRKVANALRKHNLSSQESDYNIGDYAVLSDANGHEYYVHSHTGEAVWELPNEVNAHQHVAAFDGTWELQAEDIARKPAKKKSQDVVLHQHTKTASKYAVVSANGKVVVPTFPGGTSVVRKNSSRLAAPSNVPRPSRRKSVKRPDGTWMQLPG